MVRRQEERVEIRLLRREKEALQKKADLCNVSVSEYLRRLARGVTPKEFPPKDYAKILQEMKSINQGITEIALMSGDDLEERFWRLIKAYNTIISELTKEAYEDEELPFEEETALYGSN